MHSAYSNSLIIIFIILMSSGEFLRFIAYATTPEVPDDKGVIMYNYHGVQRKVYNPLFVAIGGQLRNLYVITGEYTLKEYSDRFDKYKRSQPLD
jgi:hypothetical protein